MIFPPPSGSWRRAPPCNKRQMSRRKANKSLITCLHTVHLGETQGNWEPQKQPKYPPECHLQIKTKEILGGDQEEHSEGGWAGCRLPAWPGEFTGFLGI